MTTARAMTPPSNRRVSPSPFPAELAGTGREVESALKIMLAEMWDRVQNLAGWLASEKFDGVRAYWTGARLLSRKGNEFHAPAWFTAALPKGIPLEGELWMGRGRIYETIGILNRAKPRSDFEWKQMRFVVFDAPDHGGKFKDRIAFCKKVVNIGPGVMLLAEQIVIPDNASLLVMLKVVEGLGGEGLIAKAPWGLHEVRRSPLELKVVTRIRCEAVVMRYKPGERGIGGAMGALYARLLDANGKRYGVEFKVGTGFKYRQRVKPPPIGAIITIEHKGLNESGKPREPSFISARNYE